MRKGGGKAKGASFEREVCTQLSLWLSVGARKDLFWRSAMSGGRATIRQKKGEKPVSQHGDISAVDPLGHLLTDHFYIECKNYKDLNLTAFLLKQTGILQQFWEKTVLEAQKYAKKPLLICRQNMYPTFVLFAKPKYKREQTQIIPHVCFNIPKSDCHLMLLSDFVEHMPPPLKKE